MRLVACLACLALLGVSQTASAKAIKPQVQQIRRVANHTEIVIKDYRQRPARKPKPAAAEPTFREYDLVPPAGRTQPRPLPQPQPRTAPAQPYYNQAYQPGPNTGMAANGFMTPGGSAILSTGPYYGYGYGYGYPGLYGRSFYQPYLPVGIPFNGFYSGGFFNFYTPNSYGPNIYNGGFYTPGYSNFYTPGLSSPVSTFGPCFIRR